MFIAYKFLFFTDFFIRSRSTSRANSPEKAMTESVTPEKLETQSVFTSRPASAVRSGRSTPGRVTPSRVCKTKSKYAADVQVPTPVPEIASHSLLIENQSVLENHSIMESICNDNQSINQSVQSLSAQITEYASTSSPIAPLPSSGTPLIHDNSGFSGDEEDVERDTSLETLGMRPDGAQDSSSVGFKHFNLKNLLSFKRPSSTLPKTPSTPQVSARVADQLNQLRVDLAAAGELPGHSKPSPVQEEVQNEVLTNIEETVEQPKTELEKPATPKSATKAPTASFQQETTPDISGSKKSKAKKAAISRPTHKNRLQAYCRERLNFKTTAADIRFTEDAGQSRKDQATALLFKNNKMVINVPFRLRLHAVADQLGYHFASLVLHCVVFFLSFWLCNLLYTFNFPASEDERVNYFYELLTRQEVGSFLVHMKHTDRWFTMPRCNPEMVAMFFTILTSSFIASFTKRDATDQRAAPKIKLLKIC